MSDTISLCPPLPPHSGIWCWALAWTMCRSPIPNPSIFARSWQSCVWVCVCVCLSIHTYSVCMGVSAWLRVCICVWVLQASLAICKLIPGAAGKAGGVCFWFLLYTSSFIFLLCLTFLWKVWGRRGRGEGEVMRKKIKFMLFHLYHQWQV